MSKHVTIEEFLKQIAENTASIRQESTVRAGAAEAIDSHIGAMSTNLPNSIESHDYVPGVSGWKIDQKTGDFEINTCTLGAVGSSPERQTVSVEVCSYSKYDLPKNAANLVQFMEAELQKVPEQYRHSAEFEEFDASYSDESFNARLFLSYSRLETEEELADRLEKAKVAGTRIVKSRGCTTVISDGVVRARFGDLDQPEPVTEQSQSFKADGDKVYLNEAFVDDGSVPKAKIGAGFYFHIPGVYVDADGRLHFKREDASSDEGRDSKLSANWSIKMQLHKGQYVAAGIGLGIGSQFLVSADKFRMGCMCFGGYTGHIPLKR